MNRYAREKQTYGCQARTAVVYARNTGQLPPSHLTFWHYDILRHEMRRALLGIDAPTAWCGRNARLRRYIESWAKLPAPVLP